MIGIHRRRNRPKYGEGMTSDRGPWLSRGYLLQITSMDAQARNSTRSIFRVSLVHTGDKPKQRSERVDGINPPTPIRQKAGSIRTK